MLRTLGIREQGWVMTDGGPDFTSGVRVRARVSHQGKGGIGILERIHRPLKDEFVFREDFATMQA